jgi:hypothetical protein
MFPYAGGNAVDLSRIWNSDWEMRYLVDFETTESSQVQLESPAFTVTSGGAQQDVTGDFAHYGSTVTNNFTKNFDGGMEVLPAGSEVVGIVDSVTASPRRRYRAALHTRRISGSPATATPRVRLRFERGELEDQLSDWIETVWVVTSGRFERFETDAAGLLSPAGTVGVQLEVALDVDGEFESFDDILLFESVPSCFDGCGE